MSSAAFKYERNNSLPAPIENVIVLRARGLYCLCLSLTTGVFVLCCLFYVVSVLFVLVLFSCIGILCSSPLCFAVVCRQYY
jgi:hypothetical protein